MIQIPDSFLKRQEQRQEALHKQEPSPADVFRDTFKEKQSEIENLLNTVGGAMDKLELADVFEKVSKSITQLTRYLASSSIFLIPYDIKISQATIQSLQNRAAELEKEHLPRKKFTFKNRRDLKGSNVKKEEVKSFDVTDKPLNNPNAYSVNDESDRTLVIEHAEIRNKDVTLSKLKNCVVFVHGSPNTLHLISLVDCRVVCGPVHTSVLVEDCDRSVFAFPCQQLRVHNTRASDFRIHVTTRAIIEDSRAVRFGPYDYQYPGLDAHYESSGLDLNRNNWDDVDDFNWLVNNKQSPNWTTIPENERSSLLSELQPILNNFNNK